MLDLLIIGAGPAGSAAAIEAERLGLSAVTIDKVRFPRDKCCGDGLTTAALRHLAALGLDPATVPSWHVADEVRVAAPTGATRTFPLPRGRGMFAAAARREELDAALVSRARACGADVREGSVLESIAVAERGPATVIAGGRRIEARHVIASDGMWSPTRRLLALTLPRYRGDWHAFRQYFRNVTPTRAIHVWFERDLVPGYAWSFPLGGSTANVGFGIQRERGRPVQQMKSLWPDVLARPHVRAMLGPDAEPEGPHRAWPIPARLGRLRLAHGPVLFAGDAAGACDPLTGEGIGQALETGRLAVQCIAAAEGDTSRAAARYEAALRAGMVTDHRLARTISRFLCSSTGAQWGVSLAGATRWTGRNFARWLFEDYPRAVLGTPHRWHRRMFTGDGAFASPPADV